MKRSRGRGRRPQNAGNRSYDSNGPDVRVRGTAFQLHEKYMTLARDAMSSGDRVVAENYQQHAEHYFRILQTMSPNLPTNAASPASGGSGGSTAENGDVGVPPASDTSASDKPNGTDKNNTGAENTAKATPSDGDAPNANGVAAQSEKPTQKSRRRGPLATDDTSSDTDTDSDSDTSETASK
ncbi:MAG: DUF4167 domain-containing protein [Parvibaculales bacterium]